MPRILLEEGQHGKVTWVIEQGARRRAAARFQVRLRLERRGDHAVAAPVHLFPGRRLRRLAALLPADRPARLGQRLEALGAAARDGGAGGSVDITARAKKIVFSGFFNAGAKLSLANGGIRVDQEGKVKKIVEEVEHISFSGKRAVAQGQDITYVTERCVMKLTPSGLMVAEIAPGIDLERDVLGQAEMPLAVANDLKTPAALYRDRPIGLSLNGGAHMFDGPIASEIVTFKQEGTIGVVTLRRPEKFNALDTPMLRALEAALDKAEDADGVRIVLICGEGKGFCAGGNVKAWSQMSAADFQIKWVRYGHRVFDRLARLRQPTIAV